MLLLQPVVQRAEFGFHLLDGLVCRSDPVFHHLLPEFPGALHLDAEPEHGDLAELGIEARLVARRDVLAVRGRSCVGDLRGDAKVVHEDRLTLARRIHDDFKLRGSFQRASVVQSSRRRCDVHDRIAALMEQRKLDPAAVFFVVLANDTKGEQARATGGYVGLEAVVDGPVFQRRMSRHGRVLAAGERKLQAPLARGGILAGKFDLDGRLLGAGNLEIVGKELRPGFQVGTVLEFEEHLLGGGQRPASEE
jgi:hypothetical protein